jgi:AMP deaminase
MVRLFLKYDKSPFPKFYKRGLNVSLSTDDPLIFHLTYQPLLEEYSIASQVIKFMSIIGKVFDLTAVDVCEIARNSVLQSSFEDIVKSYWLGPRYKEDNDNANGLLLLLGLMC